MSEIKPFMVEIGVKKPSKTVSPGALGNMENVL